MTVPSASTSRAVGVSVVQGAVVGGHGGCSMSGCALANSAEGHMRSETHGRRDIANLRASIQCLMQGAVQ